MSDVRRSLALVWRTLRSMRTALVLLLLLAVAAIAGSLIPQAMNSPARVEAMFRDHPALARFYNAAGLFDVYGSWWFTFIYTLLLISLAACLLPRSRALVRNVRARPVAARELDGFRHYAERTIPADPERVITGARRVLRRRLFRVEAANGRAPGLAADKGLAREAGSLLFHWSFFLILIGIVWGKGTGFTGFAVIAEGETWTEAHANYDGNIREGRFFNEDHSGVQIRVDDFQVTYGPNLVPKDFVTRGELLDPRGNPVRRVDIRVNHPAEEGGVKFYQSGFGWAPVIEVRDGGDVLYRGPVPFAEDPPPKGVGQLQLPWHGVVRLPTLDPQAGIQFELWPDSRALLMLQSTGVAPPMPYAFAPVMRYTVYRGNLDASPVRSSTRLDTTLLHTEASGIVGAATTVDVASGRIVEPGPSGAIDYPKGLSITFPELRRYTVLEVARDRGLWIELLAAILILLGLLPALYTSRRKVWVTAEPDGGAGTVLKVGGFALQRKTQFEEEFDRLVNELAGASSGRAEGS